MRNDNPWLDSREALQYLKKIGYPRSKPWLKLMLKQRRIQSIRKGRMHLFHTGELERIAREKIQVNAPKIVAAFILIMAATAPVFAQTWTGQASWYSTEACLANPDPACPTADGSSLYKLEFKGELFLAMWDAPLGSQVQVCNAEVTRCEIFTVRDRGPNKRLNRVADLSKAGFERFADLKAGLTEVIITVLPQKQEAS